MAWSVRPKTLARELTTQAGIIDWTRPGHQEGARQHKIICNCPGPLSERSVVPLDSRQESHLSSGLPCPQRSTASVLGFHGFRSASTPISDPFAWLSASRQADEHIR